MNDEIRLAFALPEERAAATATGPVADRISLRDHIAHADIGAFQQERGQTQRLRFNIVVELLAQDGAEDDVDRILSYDTITDAISTELAAERLNLLETLAERIAIRILSEPQPMRVFVRIEKLDRGAGALGVEIVRTRDKELPPVAATLRHPVVAFFDRATLGHADLLARIERIGEGADPVILVVGLPDTERPKAGQDNSRQRINLLAMEQNAWALADRAPSIKVVATRTELDWAIGQGNNVVWAPSKMIFDTPGSPLEKSDDGLALAVWLAELLEARTLVVHGDVSVPAGCRVPVRRD